MKAFPLDKFAGELQSGGNDLNGQIVFPLHFLEAHASSQAADEDGHGRARTADDSSSSGYADIRSSWGLPTYYRSPCEERPDGGHSLGLPCSSITTDFEPGGKTCSDFKNSITSSWRSAGRVSNASR